MYVLVMFYHTKGEVFLNPQETRAKLISQTVSVIANFGLDKTTTKAIVADTGINEAYIYRYFAGKEDLLAKTFDSLDNELVEKALQYLPAMYDTDREYEARCRDYFFPIWQFLLGNREKCLAYVQYFYSPYFPRLSAENHYLRFTPVVEKFREAFIEEAEVWLILNHILNVALDFAVKVHNNQMPEDDNYGEHVFRVIYASIKQYFKTNRKSEE